MKITVKVGTSTLTHSTGRLDIRRVERLCKALSDIKNAGHDIVLVSSGAMGMGVGKMNMIEVLDDMPTKQAVAAIGQCELMNVYDRLFSEYNHTVAQILVTGEDFDDEVRRNNFRNAANRLLELKVLPIVNENDTIATDEIAVGDNDRLGALVAVNTDAELFIVLTDTDGLYTSDPRLDPDAKLIKEVTEITKDLYARVGEKGSRLSTGGMATKLQAAEISMNAGIDMVIASGSDPENLYDVLDGKEIGTRFVGRR